MKIITTLVSTIVLVGGFFSAGIAAAQTVHQDYQGTWQGEVIEVLEEVVIKVPGTETDQTVQTISVRVIDGPKEGSTVVIENDYLQLEPEQRFFFNYNVYIDGTESYGVVGVDRRASLYWLIGFFMLAVIAFGRWQGVRSLIALGGSFAAIFYILLPGILAGWNPLVASIGVAAAVLFAAIFFTHGWNRESAVAYSGTMLAVLFTGLLALWAVDFTRLTGFASEAATYLNFNTDGTLDFTALLLGAIIIGVLGVLDDIAVTQAAIVTELFNSNSSLTRLEVYQKALRIGREHVGALVNTLVLAYTGAALPLLLQFYLSSSSMSLALNTELFATEVVRMIVGSVGLIVTVPLVTGLAVWYLKDYKPRHGHTHAHGHSHG